MNCPPHWAESLLSLMVASREKYALLGDYAEEYRYRCDCDGATQARLWYINHVLRCVVTSSWYFLKWRMDMLRNAFKVTLRQMQRQKIYTTLSLAGLALALTASLLIVTFVHHEFSFDKQVPDAHRVYRVLIQSEFTPQGKSSTTLKSLAPKIEEMYPEVEQVTRLYEPAKAVLALGESRISEKGLFLVDGSFFEIFPCAFKASVSVNPLAEPNAIVLTPELAQKYFGDESAVGKALTFGDDTPLTVTAVLEPLPANVHLQFKALVSFSTVLKSDNNPWSYQCGAYVKLQPGSAPLALEAKMAQDRETLMPNFLGGVLTFLEPLSQVHFSPVSSHSVFILQQRPGLIRLLMSVAGFLLILACINHVNLSTARAAVRAKEVGVRKTLGARRLALAGQFLGESAFFVATALGVAVLLAILLHSEFESLIGRTFPLSWMTRPAMLFLFLGVYALTVFLASGYSAMVLSRFRPVGVLRGRILVSQTGSTLRQWLIFIQFAVTLVFMVGTAVVHRQMVYLMHRPLGYDKTDVWVIEARHPDAQAHAELLKSAWRQLPGVEEVSFASGGPAMGAMYSMREVDGGKVRVHQLFVDAQFVSALGLRLQQGRFFEAARSADAQSLVVNEAYIKLQELEHPLHQTVQMGEEAMPIIGVLTDFHLNALHDPIEPLTLRLGTTFCRYFFVRIRPENAAAALEAMRFGWHRHVPYAPMEFRRLEEVYGAAYGFENRLLKALGVFAGICLVICCLGLLGLTLFTLENRKKEMSIRRVLGASRVGVWRMVVRQFMGWIALAVLVAFPTAFWLLKGWLTQFAYRARWSPWVFIGSGVVALVIAGMTITLQVLHSIRQNPSQVLQCE